MSQNIIPTAKGAGGGRQDLLGTREREFTLPAPDCGVFRLQLGENSVVEQLQVTDMDTW